MRANSREEVPQSVVNLYAACTKYYRDMVWIKKPARLIKEEQDAKEAVSGVQRTKHEENPAEDFRQELLAKHNAAKAEIDVKCQLEIAQLIANCPPVVYGGKISVGATERRREGLRQIRANNTADGSVNWLQTLALVKATIDGMGIADNGSDWSQRGSRHAERY